MKKWIETLEKIYTAVVFAEANCHDTALEILGLRRKQKRKPSLDVFLRDVGLNHVRICYVTANV